MDAVRTHPVNRKTPCVLRQKLKIPAKKKSHLALKVSYHPHGDWQLVVRADKKILADQIIGPKTTLDGWADIQVDLSSYAGKEITLELENRANDWRNEWAYWGKVELVSE